MTPTEEFFPNAAKLLELARRSMCSEHAVTLECGMDVYCLHHEPGTHDTAWQFASFALHSPDFLDALPLDWTAHEAENFFSALADFLAVLC